MIGNVQFKALSLNTKYWTVHYTILYIKGHKTSSIFYALNPEQKLVGIV